MFETMESPQAGDSSVLSPVRSGLEQLNTMREHKEVLARAQFRQVDAATSFFDLCCAEDEHRGINQAHSGEQACAELSAALAINEGVITSWIALGLDMRHRLRRTRTAFAAGTIDLHQAQVISALLAGVSDNALDTLEAAILDGPSLPPTKLRARTRRLIARLDPDSARTRITLAAADRDVRIRPGENGVSHVDGTLPAADATTVAMRLRHMAIHDVCAHDPRTMPQRRADALTALADGTGQLACRCESADCPARAAATPGTKTRPLIQVVINAATLFGLDNHTAHLGGYGTIDADTARTLAADGVFERVYALAAQPDNLDDTVRGQILAIAKTAEHHGIPNHWAQGRADKQARTYTPSVKLAARIRARDGHCRFPNCQVAAIHCDLDHTIAFNHEHPDTGGLTIDTNLACLCRRQLGGAALQWTTPRGETLTTEPAGAALWLLNETPDDSVPHQFQLSNYPRAQHLLTHRSHCEDDLSYLVDAHTENQPGKPNPGPWYLKHPPIELAGFRRTPRRKRPAPF